MKLLVKFPTRDRADKFEKVFNLYRSLSTNPNTFYLITIDKDDAAMIDWSKTNDSLDNVAYHIVTPEGKISAINKGIDMFIDSYDIILLASDDMIPHVKGWDDIIISDMNNHYPDTDGVLHYNDGYMGKKLNSLAILGKAYYKRFGYIYHPSYKSLFCDNEFMEVAAMLRKQTYINRMIIKHEHPFFNNTKQDSLYIKNNSLFKLDQSTYNGRKLNNFYLANYNIII